MQAKLGHGSTDVATKRCWLAHSQRRFRLHKRQQSGLLLLLFLTVSQVHGVTRYVSPLGGDVPPFTNWSTAATTIRAATDASGDEDTVLVTNGVYNIGGAIVSGKGGSNRIAMTHAMTVQSLNGTDVTHIQGQGPISDQAVRCAYVGEDARLQGFTLTNGHTTAVGDLDEKSGGGVWCEPSAVVSNCVITGNQAKNNGGGTYNGTILNCSAGITGELSVAFITAYTNIVVDHPILFQADIETIHIPAGSKGITVHVWDVVARERLSDALVEAKGKNWNETSGSIDISFVGGLRHKHSAWTTYDFVRRRTAISMFNSSVGLLASNQRIEHCLEIRCWAYHVGKKF